MIRRNVLSLALVALTMAACSTTTTDGQSDVASKRQTIDASVDGAMAKLYTQVPGSRELVAKSKGVLVFPAVLSAGFGIGGSYGEGSLRSGSRTLGYYSTATGSVGFLAGAESKALYVLFMNQESLDKFRASDGWTAGADASVTLLTMGADAGIDTQTASQGVVGYALSNAGLMANLSLDGTKVTRLDY